jgi:preprotein translocase subunit SecA
MDYLREGINLRAMGQKDPLTEWQREGFGMFEAMMKGVATDFVKYVMQVQVNVVQPENAEADPVPAKLEYTAPDESLAGGGLAAAAAAGPIEDAGGGAAAPAAPVPEAPPANVPTVKSEWDKTPRNAPCPCGSGKKFKLCHGA